jgi:hypothetical protein
MEAASNCSHTGRFLRPPATVVITGETSFRTGRFLRPPVTVVTTAETSFRMGRFLRPPVTVVTTAGTCGWCSFPLVAKNYSGFPVFLWGVGVWF